MQLFGHGNACSEVFVQILMAVEVWNSSAVVCGISRALATFTLHAPQHTVTLPGLLLCV